MISRIIFPILISIAVFSQLSIQFVIEPQAVNDNLERIGSLRQSGFTSILCGIFWNTLDICAAESNGGVVCQTIGAGDIDSTNTGPISSVSGGGLARQDTTEITDNSIFQIVICNSPDTIFELEFGVQNSNNGGSAGNGGGGGGGGSADGGGGGGGGLTTDDGVTTKNKEKNAQEITKYHFVQDKVTGKLVQKKSS